MRKDFDFRSNREGFRWSGLRGLVEIKPLRFRGVYIALIKHSLNRPKPAERMVLPLAVPRGLVAWFNPV